MIQKLIIEIITAVTALCILCTGGCGGGPENLPSDTKDGISVTLRGMRFEQKGIHTVIPDIEIRNESGQDIMEVFYKMTFYDAHDAQLGESFMFYLREEPIKAGATAIQDDSRFVLNFREDPARAELQVTGYKTTDEMPPVRVPKEGEFLYQALDSEALNSLPENPPARITVHIDRMGFGQEAVFEKGRGLEEAVDAFLKIRVGPDGAPMVTDNYNWFLFEWEDGTRCMIRLNLYCLEYSANGIYHSYYLTDSEDFWRLAQANLG